MQDGGCNTPKCSAPDVNMDWHIVIWSEIISRMILTFLQIIFGWEVGVRPVYKALSCKI